MTKNTILTALVLCLLLAVQADARQITDSCGRSHIIPEKIQHIICSGPGCLRMLTYLQAQDLIAGVDSIETRKTKIDARPYALANLQFKQMEVFGEFRGHDNPEKILSLASPPQLIFKTFPQMGHDPVELEQKTGIPVLSLYYGDLSSKREQFYTSLRIMGQALAKEQRAEEVISFFDNHIAELQKKSANTAPGEKPTVFLGGVSFKGPHGFQSTEPDYPPFSFISTANLAKTGITEIKELQHSNIAKEKIVEWDPDILFLDLSTLRLGDNGGGLHELKTDPAYATLTAVQNNKVFGLLPYNSYSGNHGSTLANSYFIGKLLYPKQFFDINPAAKADEIYTFLLGKPMFSKMNNLFNKQVFQPITVTE